VGRDACYAKPSPGFVECTTCSNYPFVSHLNTQQLTCSVPHSGPPHAASGGVFKNAAVSTLRHEQRLMTTGEITKYVVLEGRFVSNSLPWTTFTSPHTTWPRRARQRAGIHTARAARPADRGNAETNVEHQCVCKSSNASRDHSRDASGPGRGLPDRVDTRHARFLLRRVRAIATRVPRETRVSTAPEATHRTAHPPKRAVPFRPTKPKALTDTYFPFLFFLKNRGPHGVLGEPTRQDPGGHDGLCVVHGHQEVEIGCSRKRFLQTPGRLVRPAGVVFGQEPVSTTGGRKG